MNQTQLSFSGEDTTQLLNRVAFTPSRAVRQLPRKDYAQMHNGRPTPAHGPAPTMCTRGRSASPLPTNHHTPARQRSPISPFSQDTLEPSDSVSQTPYRVPDVIKKTWKKKPRTGVRTTFSDVYEYFETVPIANDVWYKKKDTQFKTPYLNKQRLCLLCQEDEKYWGSTDKSREGSSSNLWKHLKKYHEIYPPGQEPVSGTWSQTTLTSQGFTSYGGGPPPDMPLEQAIIQWIVDSQQPFNMVEGTKWK
jgi:hypothetical protein